MFCDLCEGECAPGACGDGVGGCLEGDKDCLNAVGLKLIPSIHACAAGFDFLQRDGAR